jgi:hypothetical protein
MENTSKPDQTPKRQSTVELLEDSTSKTVSIFHIPQTKLLYVDHHKGKKKSKHGCTVTRRKIFRLLSNYADNLEKNISTTSSSISSITASTAACYAQGLAAAHSRKLLATLGGSTSTRPGVRKITLKTCGFIDISNVTIPTTLGGSTTTSPPIVDTIL